MHTYIKKAPYNGLACVSVAKFRNLYSFNRFEWNLSLDALCLPSNWPNFKWSNKHFMHMLWEHLSQIEARLFLISHDNSLLNPSTTSTLFIILFDLIVQLFVIELSKNENKRTFFKWCPHNVLSKWNIVFGKWWMNKVT